MMAGADPYAEPVTSQTLMPAASIQKQCIERLLRTQLRHGDEWYLVACWWFKQWKSYVGFDRWNMYYVGHWSHHPGPIDNSKLFLDNVSQTLKENLLDGLDYVLLPSEAWNKLVRWYGCLGVRGPIVRKVVERGLYVKHCEVEIYLVQLHLCENNNMEKVVKRHFSRADTIDTIEKEMRSLFNIPREKETRLWARDMSNMYEQLNKPNSTVQDAALLQGQVLVIEWRDEDGTWPRQSKHSRSTASTSQRSSSSPMLSSGSPATISSTLSNVNAGTNSNYVLNSSTFSSKSLGGYSPNSTSYNYKEPQSEPGLCGLSNLGNTCFMNSALQCLSNTPPLTEYFLNGQYGAEINRENPLGMRGGIAEAYAGLIKQLWLSRSSFLAPRSFKTQVGRFAPQFSGVQEQDSQELLAFLLDGLHEDLNRVKKKPYVAQREAEGRPDEIVAREAWSNHCLRNNSIIVDIFHGLFKSTLVCPDCSKISVTFDPFCYLSLPLPMKKRCNIKVLLVRADPNTRPVQYRVAVPKQGTVADLCAALRAISGLPAENMVVADVCSHRFHKLYRLDDSLSNILEKDDILVYEVKEEDVEKMNLPLYFRERLVKRTSGSRGAMLFGRPLIITIPRHNLTIDLLYETVLRRIRRYVKHPKNSAQAKSSASQSSGNSSSGGQAAASATGANHNGNLRTTESPHSLQALCRSGFTKGSDRTQEERSTTCNGPNRMYEEQEAMDQQISPEPESWQFESLAGGVEDSQSLENNPDISTSSRKLGFSRNRLFSFSIVNSDGTATISSLPSEGNILKLNPHSTVAMDWSLEIKKLCFDDEEAEAFEKHESVLQQREAAVALRECIQLFTTTETLGEQDPWYCLTCETHQQASKKFDLWSLPHILVVHLKRFSYNRCWRDKLDTVVDFPIRDLNMTEFVCDPRAEPYIYDLIAVSNHSGGISGGHYTAYCKNKSDGKWHYFDDSCVYPATEDQIVTKAAYVLFYQRRDGDRRTSSPSSSSMREASEVGADHMDTI